LASEKPLKLLDIKMKKEEKNICDKRGRTKTSKIIWSTTKKTKDISIMMIGIRFYRMRTARNNIQPAITWN